MTEKVKIPQEVADAIEKLRDAEYTDYGIVRFTEDGGPIPVENGSELQCVLWDWSFEGDCRNADLLLDVLRVGYEVEPEYKIGDWVVSREGHFGEVDRVEGQVFHGRWFNEKGRVFAMRCGFTDFKRLATPEEIKAEKERRLWKSIGREVGEFREGDVGRSHKGSTTAGTSNIEAWHKTGYLKGFHPVESFVSFEDGDTND